MVNEIEATFANGGYRSKESIEGSISDAYDAYLRLAKPYDTNPSLAPSQLDESRARSLMVALANLGERARSYGITLNPEMEQIVRGAQANRANVSLMDTYGSQVGGGTLSARQTTRSTSVSYQARETFFAANPHLRGQVWVHHSIEWNVMNLYPGRFTLSEIQSLNNLRGIPNAQNSSLHLSQIRLEWNTFYRNNPNATRQQIIDQATRIDARHGGSFNPPLKK